MSTQAENNALALHEILLSISDSLNHAQNQLRNMPPYDQYGRPNTLYQLPYLDFSLEVITEASSTIQSESNTILRPNNIMTRLLGSQTLKFSPVPVSNQEIGKSTNKITSTISGRFVAILPNEGMPQMLISIQLMKVEGSELNFKIISKLQILTGQPVEGKRVEINFDNQSSNSLNGSEIPSPIFKGNNEGFTDINGNFETEVILPESTIDEVFVFVVNSGPIFSSIALSKS